MSKKVLTYIKEGYNYQQLKKLLSITLKSGISVLLRGHPGIGKSSLAIDLSSEMNLELIDIRLAQKDPAEITGVYFPNKETKSLDLYPPQWVIKASQKPSFVFLDEVNAAITKLHQAAAYQIILEHRVGEYKFHKDTVVLAAGNLEEDNAIVSSLSSALCNRFAHYIMKVDSEVWVKWGEENNINELILAYISRYGEEVLYNNNSEYAFPSPRSWEMASKVFSNSDELNSKRAVAACIGFEASEKLFNFYKIFYKVNAKKIIFEGKKIEFIKGKNSDPSFIYAAIFSVASYITNEAEIEDKYLPNIIKFLKSPGLEVEYVFLFLRHINRRSKVLNRLKPLKSYRELASNLVDLRVGMYK